MTRSQVESVVHHRRLRVACEPNSTPAGAICKDRIPNPEHGDPILLNQQVQTRPSGQNRVTHQRDRIGHPNHHSARQHRRNGSLRIRHEQRPEQAFQACSVQMLRATREHLVRRIDRLGPQKRRTCSLGLLAWNSDQTSRADRRRGRSLCSAGQPSTRLEQNLSTSATLRHSPPTLVCRLPAARDRRPWPHAGGPAVRCAHAARLRERAVGAPHGCAVRSGRPRSGAVVVTRAIGFGSSIVEDRRRPADVEALSVFDSICTEQFECGSVLDAFGDG